MYNSLQVTALSSLLPSHPAPNPFPTPSLGALPISFFYPLAYGRYLLIFQLQLGLPFFIFLKPPHHPQTWPFLSSAWMGMPWTSATQQKAWIRWKGVDFGFGQFEIEVLVGNPVGDVSRQWVLTQGRDNDWGYGFETHHKIKANVFITYLLLLLHISCCNGWSQSLYKSPPIPLLRTMHQHFPLSYYKHSFLHWINLTRNLISLNYKR